MAVASQREKEKKMVYSFSFFFLFFGTMRSKGGMRGATDDGCVLFALSWDLGLGWVGSVKKYF